MSAQAVNASENGMFGTTNRATAIERGRMVLNLALVGVLVALAVVLVTRFAPQGGGTHESASVPRSAALEAATGVRVSRVAVVADGGLVTVFYVVLDPEKATRFQADRAHTPTLTSEARQAHIQRTSMMRTGGHAMRAGQTYYLVYDNAGSVLRSGESVTVTYLGASLHHVPVL